MDNLHIVKISYKLEPVIITYNRAEMLRKTLSFFQMTGFSHVKMHVLDNASTDDTKMVVESFQKNWPQLIYHKNQYNIGGNGNILRSIEISNSEYHWVIGDDDEWLMNSDTIHELSRLL